MSFTEYLPRTFGHLGDVVVERLERWFTDNGRTLAWRLDRAHARERAARGDVVNDPYVVLVSEVMLQQTQVSRVEMLLPTFLERFPDVTTLALASRGDVLRAWRGLGYNSRAVRLLETAREIAERCGGEFPREVSALGKLGGIGPYTSAAIACFAFGAHVPVVDVNVQRVLSRVFFKCHTIDARQSVEAITRLDGAVTPSSGSYWWHQALMDLGATICTARRPACERCPLSRTCLSAYPRMDALYGSRPMVPEPVIAGSPRRIWRGRVIEILRSRHEGMEIDDLLEALPPYGAHDRAELVAVVDRLLAEGMLSADTDRVAECGRGMRIRLPQ